MPVRRFRSVEEMNQPVWRDPGSAELYQAIRKVWEFGQRTSQRQFKPGVYRFRSIDEMQRAAATLIADDSARQR